MIILKALYKSVIIIILSCSVSSRQLPEDWCKLLLRNVILMPTSNKKKSLAGISHFFIQKQTAAESGINDAQCC